jgi:HEAT repeat protein
MRREVAYLCSSLSLFKAPDLKTEIVKALTRLLTDADVQVALYAAISLRKWDTRQDVMPVVERALASRSARLRAETLVQLSLMKLGPAGMKLAAKGLDDADAKVRADAAWALGSYQQEAALHVPALARRLTDTNQAVRVSAAKALGEIARRPDVAVPGLSAALSDKAPEVRRQAALSLAKFERAAAPAVARLLERFQSDPDPEVRSNAVYALGCIGPDARAAAPAIRKAIDALPPPPAATEDILRFKEYNDQRQTLEGALRQIESSK